MLLQKCLNTDIQTTKKTETKKISPFSRGSAIMVILFFLLGVSAKHLRLEVSTTVSQKLTTGSATLMSISE